MNKYGGIVSNNMKKIDTFLILHNIRSSHNVGAIFRTADAAGISKIFLTGYTPCPVDKFGRDQSKISKSALGAEKFVEWEYFKSPSTLIRNLQKEKTEVIAVEQGSTSVDYKKIKLTKNSAFLFGNEVRGVSKSLLKLCDKVSQIDMKGKKESLNVSVTVGVFLFRVLNI